MHKESRGVMSQPRKIFTRREDARARGIDLLVHQRYFHKPNARCYHIAQKRRLPNPPCWPAARASIGSFLSTNRAWFTVITPANRVSVANPKVAYNRVISPTEL